MFVHVPHEQLKKTVILFVNELPKLVPMTVKKCPLPVKRALPLHDRVSWRRLNRESGTFVALRSVEQLTVTYHVYCDV